MKKVVQRGDMGHEVKRHTSPVNQEKRETMKRKSCGAVSLVRRMGTGGLLACSTIIGQSPVPRFGINYTGSPPNDYAILDIDVSGAGAPRMGLLIPRVCLANASDNSFGSGGSLGTTETSLLVYHNPSLCSGSTTLSAGFYYWDGTQWKSFFTSANFPNFTCATDNYVLKRSGGNIGCSQIYDDGLKVGIGTTSPGHKLSIKGGPLWTSSNWGGAIELSSGGAIAWGKYDPVDKSFGIGKTSFGNGFYFWYSDDDPGNQGNPAQYLMVIKYPTGNVGIGTTTPAQKLDVAGRGIADYGFEVRTYYITIGPIAGDLGDTLNALLAKYDRVSVTLQANTTYTWNKKVWIRNGKQLFLIGQGYQNGAQNITVVINMTANGTFTDPNCNGGNPTRDPARVAIVGAGLFSLAGVEIQENANDSRPLGCSTEHGGLFVIGGVGANTNRIGSSRSILVLHDCKIYSTENVVSVGYWGLAEVHFGHTFIYKQTGSIRDIYAVWYYKGWNFSGGFGIIKNSHTTLGPGVSYEVDPHLYYTEGNSFHIDPNTGRIGIGTTTPQAKLEVTGYVLFATGINTQTAGPANIRLGADNVNDDIEIGTTNPNIKQVTFWNTAGFDMDIKVGCVQYNNGTLGTCASDLALKSNVEDLFFGNALNKILALQPKAFEFKKEPGRIYHGLVAQDVEKVAPELVTTDEKGVKYVKYGDIQWLMLEAIKEQQKIIEEQQSKIEKLQKEIEELKRSRDR